VSPSLSPTTRYRAQLAARQRTGVGEHDHRLSAGEVCAKRRSPGGI
jgi:hypothetical protein